MSRLDRDKHQRESMGSQRRFERAETITQWSRTGETYHGKSSEVEKSHRQMWLFFNKPNRKKRLCQRVTLRDCSLPIARVRVQHRI